MAACWSCAKDAGDTPFCAACGKIQPARARDPFNVLGLPRTYRLEVAAVEKAQREGSKRLHPDRFSRAEARERRFAVEQSTQLNEAVKTLKDPVRRAEHLLRSEGFALATEEAGARQALPLAFYEEVMADREALDEARPQGPAAVEALATRMRERRAAVMRMVDEAFAAWEAGAGRDALTPAVAELAKLRYYARFLDEVEGASGDER